MTPLAHKLAKHLVQPDKDLYGWRSAEDKSYITHLLDDVHCFEVSSLVRNSNELFAGVPEEYLSNYLRDHCLMPAPNTWLEYLLEDGDRTALLCKLIPEESEEQYQVYVVTNYGANILAFFTPKDGKAALVIPQKRTEFVRALEMAGVTFESFARQQMYRLVRLLAAISTSGLTDHRTRAPHKGLARQLKSLAGGHFPLHAWHEVTIDLGDERKALTDLDPEAREAHLSGRKCLHFVRSHFRVLGDGKLAVVRSHWRGDASLGIARTRYKVK